ncbi:unnamed protein product [Calypogeia fissa]
MEADGNGEFMEGVNYGRNGNDDLPTREGDEEEDEEVAAAKAEARDEQKLENVDTAKQVAANEWLTQFVAMPFAWTAALSVAFPPEHYSGVGRSMEVRYFTLNILLGKIRSDWIQLGSDDAWEIYQTVLGQLPSNLDDPWFASRLLVLVSAAAAVAGEEAAIELVRQCLGPKPIVEGSLVYELLTAIGEEVFMRTFAHSAEVVAAMREISTEVFQFLETKVNNVLDSQQSTNIFICLERWMNAGFTLSELYSSYPNLLKALFGALNSQDDKCFEAAVSTLSEYIAAVDLLPERGAAVRLSISAILAHRQLYVAAGSTGELASQYLKSRSRGLVILVTVLASSEASLVAQGGDEVSSLLDWLVDASGGGGGLSFEGATIAAAAWPRLAAVPVPKRSDILNASRFATAAKAILQAQKYPDVYGDWDISGFEDEFVRYREGAAADALIAFLEQLGTTLLSYLLSELQQAMTWQSAELCLFATATLSHEIKALAGLSGAKEKLTSSQGEQLAARSFLSAIFVWISANPPPAEQERSTRINLKLVQTILLVVEKLAEWTAIDLKSLEAGIKYAMSALQISKVRGSAAKALGEVCRAAAPHIVAAPVLQQVFGAYELALSRSDRLEVDARLGFVEGLAAVGSALPPTEAAAALKTITFASLSTVKVLAEMRAAANINGQVLAEELRVLAVVVSHSSPREGTPASVHPALPILSEIWPALDVVAGHWSGDADVVTALCELWGVVSSRLGMVLSAVLPSIIKSATAMYIQHLVPACLDCLSNIVALGATNTDIDPEVDRFLSATLLEVLKTIAPLNKIVEDARSRRGPNRNTQIGREVEPDDVQQQNAEAALCSISKLARSLLHNKPHILLGSAAFMEIIHSAIGCIRRTEYEPALASAKLLSETILCLSFSEDDFKGKVVWQLPSDLVPYVDKVVERCGAHVAEVVLQTLARFQLLESLRDALADLLYGLCMRYPGETQTHMEVILNAKDFPARKGVLKLSNKQSFISAATIHPVHPRRKFQDLINNFSQVCRGSAPAEVLAGY